MSDIIMPYEDTSLIKERPRCPRCFYIGKVVTLYYGTYQQNLSHRGIEWICTSCRVRFMTPEQAVLLISNGDQWKQVRI